MKKKVFFILSSLKAGGAERVFWLISQNFNQSKYEVILVILNSENPFFTTELLNIQVRDLGSIRASRSIISLCRLIKEEKPHAIFSTGGQIDILVAISSFFTSVPFLIARGTNIPEERLKYANFKARSLAKVSTWFYRRFNKIICQTLEMKSSWERKAGIQEKNLVVINNPVLSTDITKQASISNTTTSLIMVGSFSKKKGHERLLQVMNLLPPEFTLTLVGTGSLEAEICNKLTSLDLNARVHLAGQVSNVVEMIAKHDIFVLSSFVEGFPNVVLEALSVGVPVISFQVSGISELIVDGFNGFIVAQGDLDGFRNKIIEASRMTWDPKLIKEDVNRRFAIYPIVSQFESLIE